MAVLVYSWKKIWRNIHQTVIISVLVYFQVLYLKYNIFKNNKYVLLLEPAKMYIYVYTHTPLLRCHT